MKNKATPLKASRSCSWQITDAAPNPNQRWESVDEYNQIPFAKALENYPTNVLQRAYVQFEEKINNAVKGLLLYGQGHRFDVDDLKSTLDVLELKWRNNPPQIKNRKQLWLRIYFAEPLSEAGLLLNLNMQCKSVDQSDEQTQQAMIAQARFESWKSELGE